MNKVNSRRFRYVAERLSEREYFDAIRMRAAFFSDCSHKGVVEVMELFESEGIPVGLLRPSDVLEAVLAPPPTYNPLVWLNRRPAYEDAITELHYRLGLRLETSRLEDKFDVSTFGKFVRVWCAAESAGGV